MSIGDGATMAGGAALRRVQREDCQHIMRTICRAMTSLFTDEIAAHDRE
jgi:hypothetical protein